MSHIKTSSGFETDIDESRLDDYRLTKAIREAQTSLFAIVDVVGFVLGEDEDRLIDHLVATTGKVSHADLRDEMNEIFTQLNESKKK